MQNSKQGSRAALISLMPFAFLVILFELVPVCMVLVLSFKAEKSAAFTLGNYTRIFSKKLYQQSILNSFSISMFSSCVGIVVGFIGAKAMCYASGICKTLYRNVLHMCSNFSGIPLAFSYIIMFGNVGVFMILARKYGILWLAGISLYSITGLVMVYIYFQIPLAILLLIPAFSSLKKDWQEAVNLLGGNNTLYWFKIGLPCLLPQLLSTFSVLFANALAAYATAYALLANNFSLLPIRISEQFIGDLVQRKEFGSAMAVLLMLFMLGSLLVQNKIVRTAEGKSNAK